MNAVKHTEGPWSVRKVGGDFNGSTPWLVESDNGGQGWGLVARATEETDARLIAVAPEMLAALRGALEELVNYEGDCEGYEAPEGLEYLRGVIADVRAVIAKAEGVK